MKIYCLRIKISYSFSRGGRTVNDFISIRNTQGKRLDLQVNPEKQDQ